MTIWDEVLLKFGVYFGRLVSMKKVLSESSHRIDTHLDVVVECFEVQIWSYMLS